MLLKYEDNDVEVSLDKEEKMLSIKWNDAIVVLCEIDIINLCEFLSQNGF